MLSFANRIGQRRRKKATRANNGVEVVQGMVKAIWDLARHADHTYGDKKHSYVWTGKLIRLNVRGQGTS